MFTRTKLRLYWIWQQFYKISLLVFFHIKYFICFWFWWIHSLKIFLCMEYFDHAIVIRLEMCSAIFFVLINLFMLLAQVIGKILEGFSNPWCVRYLVKRKFFIIYLFYFLIDWTWVRVKMCVMIRGRQRASTQKHLRPP